MKFFDFCSGIGGGRLGLTLNGFECVGNCEIDNNAQKTYELFYNDYNNFGDLMRVDISNLPNFDIMIAGFPCQTFSILGKRTGFEDYRGQIIYGLAEILKIKKNPYFIFENVKGLVNHNNGNTLNTICDLLKSLGYVIEYKVLNSIDYGVPQMRERVYIVGIHKDVYKDKFEFPQKRKNVNIIDFLNEKNNDILALEDSTFQKYINNKYNAGRININDILSNEYTILDCRQSDLRIYYNKIPTLRNGRHGILYVKNRQLHKISGYEALLLQGFPKNFAEISIENNILNSKLLSQCGNAMTVPVIQAIGEQLLKCI